MAGIGDHGGQGLPPRGRLRVVLAVAALVIAGAGTVAVVVRDDDGGAKTRVLGEVVTTSSTVGVGAPETPASTTTSVAGTTVPGSTTTTPRTTTTSRTTTTRRATTSTTSSPACRNSTDPACGPFRWEGVTTNRGLRLEIQSPAAARVGEVVTFTITASDPDAGGPGPSQDVAFGDGTGQVQVPVFAPCNRYGTWTVPSPTAGQWVRTFTHAYDHAGTFEAAFTLTSATPGLPGCRDESINVGDPWASTTTIKISVVVAAPT